MKLSAIRFIIVLSFLFLEFGAAQPPNPLDFFPHQVGDHWEYRDASDLQLTEVLTVERDSVDSLGNIFIKYAQRNDFTVHIDTNYNVFTWNSIADTNVSLWYKLDAQVGDRWLVWVGVWDTLYATLVEIYNGYIFNNIPTTFKVIDYWLTPDSFWVQTRTIASDFGLAQNFVEGGSLYYLAGAIIDSIPYGWLTQQAIDEPNGPGIRSFELYQNYPNPFNPETTISYQLPPTGQAANNQVNLTVYNLNGQIVRRLVKGNQPAGTYSVKWDGTDDHGVPVASGVYFYRLTTGSGFVATRKMVLLR